MRRFLMPRDANDAAGATPTQPTLATPGTIAVHRALAILRCFEDGEHTKRLSDLARAVGLSPSTAHRLLSVLVADGFLSKDEDTERYRLGRTLVLLGQVGARDAHLHHVQTVLQETTRETGESTSVAVRDGAAALVIAAASSPQRLKFEHTVGSRIALHASGMGKILLAFADSDVGAVPGAQPLEAFTATTITDPVVLSDELAAIRSRGWAANHGERYEGVNGLSCPIRDAHGTVVAAIGIQGPANRFTSEQEKSLLRAIELAVDKLTGAIDPSLISP